MLRDILDQYRDQSTSLRNQGDRFEALIQAYLLSDPTLYQFIIRGLALDGVSIPGSIWRE